ncbi:MAG: flagellar M-ring protein FliF C-terminal domain-containing protein [Candidatus Avigastranaerophilus sp.]
MNFQELLKNKNVLYALIGVAAFVLILVVTVVILAVSGNSSSTGVPKEKKLTEDFVIITTDNPGKALEIQTLLARSNIEAKSSIDGSKTRVYLQKNAATTTDRDRALIEVVKSGLVDQNVGLEIFDKNDFTSTREDKRIKLVRAVNGELSRLIRRMPRIENASVLVSIPENSMFKADKKPISATVVLTVQQNDKYPDRIDDSTIRAIKSLLLGSVSGLDGENISITDTNGNVYNSLIKSIDDQISKVQEFDEYMKKKVSAQLDRLVGQGNYVVTVSTFLNQIPSEETSITYDPAEKTSITEQTFKEGLGDESVDSSKGSDAVSVYLPNGLQNTASSSSQNKNYERTATEVTYGVGKTHRTKLMKAGTIQKISIAATIDANAMPANMTEKEVKTLIAHAASPNLTADDVSIAYVETIDPYLASDRPVNLPVPAASGNPWWLALVLIIGGLFVGFVFVHKKLKDSSSDQADELKQLKEKAKEQEKQIADVNLKAAELIEKQTILTQELLEQQKQMQIENKPENDVSLDEAIDDISSDIVYADSDKTLKELKSWIEKS